jgi:hypothetical protein
MSVLQSIDQRSEHLAVQRGVQVIDTRDNSDPLEWSYSPSSKRFIPVRNFLKQLIALIPDRLYFAIRYFLHFHRWPDYNNPKHFNEFTHVYIMTCRDPLLTTVADKATVRDYISKTVGSKYLVPVHGIWDVADQVPVDELPRPFVLKDSLGNERNIFVGNRSKIDVTEVHAKLRAWQSSAYWKSQREWAYRGGTSRILAEVFLNDGSGHLPSDFKLYTIGGKVQFIQVDRGRFGTHTRNLYSVAWDLLPVRLSKQRHEVDTPPVRLQEMIAASEKLAQPFEFLRVDFYCVGDNLYIGELTNYSGAGFEHFIPSSFGIQLGDQWRAAKERRRKGT